MTVEQIIATGWPAAESHDAAERIERAKAILALFEPLREELAAAYVDHAALRREIESRGQAISHAMGRYRGTEELIPAVARLSTEFHSLRAENATLKARVGEEHAVRLDHARAVIAKSAELARQIVENETLRAQLADAERVIHALEAEHIHFGDCAECDKACADGDELWFAASEALRTRAAAPAKEPRGNEITLCRRHGLIDCSECRHA